MQKITLKLIRNCTDAQLQSPTFFKCERNIDGKVVGYTNIYATATAEEMSKGEKKPIIYPFDKGVKFVRIVLDLDKEEGEGLKKRKPHLDFLTFLKGDSRLTKPEGSPLFTLVNETQEAVDNVRVVKTNLQVAKKIDALGKGLYNLCHYLGLPVGGKGLEEIYDMLMNFKTGLAFYGTYLVDGKKRPLSEKILGYEADIEAMLYVVVNKAILLKIVELRGGMYYYGTSMIGENNISVYSFFKNNDKLFEALQLSVGENEKDLYSVVDETLWSSEEKNKENSLEIKPKEYSADEIANIQERARILGVPAAKVTKNMELLLSKIKQYEEAAEKEALRIAGK